MAIEITNFKSGLACTHTRMEKNGIAWICQPTENVLLTDQGICVLDGAEKPCTWVGFEFDYANAEKGEVLQCVSETSIPEHQGNPTNVSGRPSKSEKYEIRLDEDAGHFFNPQYFVFTGLPEDRSTIKVRGRCSSNSKVLFQYDFIVRYPVVPDPKP